MKSPLLNFAGIAIRLAHERRQGIDENTLVMCLLKRVDVVPEINAVTRHHSSTGRSYASIRDYEADSVSKKQLRIILSYMDSINRAVQRN